MGRKYSVRTIAFIDILGFKNLIYTQKAEYIAEVLDNLHRISIVDSTTREYDYLESYEVAYFSDSIVLSCDNSSDYGFIDNILDLQIELMRKGIFVRGCITKGNLYHKDNYIYGPAIIDAYLEESKIAKYPRIILGKDYSYEGTYFCKDYDGILFLDPFRRMQGKEWNEDFTLDTAVKEIVLHVEKNIKENSGVRDIYMKYSWLKQIINEVFYIEDDKYKYFWPSNSTYDRNDAHKKLRDTLLKVRKSKM